MIWTALTAIAALVSMVAFVLTALYVRAELKGLEKDRYINVTNELFGMWQSREFLESQFWLLHRLEEANWSDFVHAHRGDVGEMAFHRVGSFYDRVGTLIRLGLVDQNEILSTLGGYAIATWQKIEPLVREARRIEHSNLFDDYEKMLPACYECYVPALGESPRVTPFSLEQPVPRISRDELRRKLDRDEAVIVLDVRQPHDREQDPRTLPNAVVMAPDEVEQRYRELAAGREVTAYCA